MYIDPEIYNESKLNEQDKNEIEFWRTIFQSAVGNAVDDLQTAADELGKGVCVNLENFLEKFSEKVDEHFEYSIQDYIVSRIESYDEE